MGKDPFIYTPRGDIIVSENADPDAIINSILADEIYADLELGIGLSFRPEFIGKLMFSGFYITSDLLNKDTLWFDLDDENSRFSYFPLLNIWKRQTVLFFDHLHESKSIRRLVKNYELRINYNFERVLERCVEAHGDVWITPPLKRTLIKMRHREYHTARAVSFEVYKDGALQAGEFGVKTGKIYTSYSGFYLEPSAGSVQLLMMLRYLRDNGYIFCNLGTDDSIENNI